MEAVHDEATQAPLVDALTAMQMAVARRAAHDAALGFASAPWMPVEKDGEYLDVAASLPALG